MELLLVLIIALMVFGPDKLPEIGAKLGRAMRDMRQATRQFSQEIEETRQAIEAPLEAAREAGAEAAQPLQEAVETATTIGQALTHPDELLREAVTRNLGLDQREDGGVEARKPAADESAAPTEAVAIGAALEAAADTVPGQTMSGEPAEQPKIEAAPEEPMAAEDTIGAAQSEDREREK
jgi:TatA/E family protein of Tat protein translocase